MESVHNTFSWTPETVRFMADAAAYGDFPRVMAGAVAAAAQGCTHICDAACGTGYLAQALLAYYPEVTAIDASPTALSVLRAAAGEAAGLQILEADLFSLPPTLQFDAMVFCFFGSMPQTLQLLRRHCRRTAVLIKRTHPQRQFAAGMPHRNTASSAEQALQAHAISYHAKTLRVEMGQPFRTEADAVRFARAYSSAPERVDPAEVCARLQTVQNHAEFHYYLPRLREIQLISFDMNQMQEDES